MRPAKSMGITAGSNGNHSWHPVRCQLLYAGAVYDSIFRVMINNGGSRAVAANAVRGVLERMLLRAYETGISKSN